MDTKLIRHPKSALLCLMTSLLLWASAVSALASVEAFERARTKIEALFPGVTFFARWEYARDECGSGNYLNRDVTVDEGSETLRYWFYYCGKEEGVELVLPMASAPSSNVDEDLELNEYAREAFEITDSADVSTQALSAYHGALNKLIEPVAPSGTIKQTDYSEERNPFVAPETLENKDAIKECRANTAAAINEIDARIGELHQSMPTWGEGPQVDVGSCASRLRKLEGNFLCCRTFSNYAATWEEISCLSLKKFYLRKSCSCQGGSYSTNEALQDSVLERYAAVKLLRTQALKKGIKNPLIRQYVKDASAAVDCISDSSLAKLNRIEAELGYAVSLE